MIGLCAQLFEVLHIVTVFSDAFTDASVRTSDDDLFLRDWRCHL